MGFHRLFEKKFAGRGSLLTFHRIADAVEPDSYATRPLSIGRAYFRTIVEKLLRCGYEIVTLDEAAKRLAAEDAPSRKFVCLTFDDGYRDNYEHAFPVCKDLNVPMTVYVTTGFLSRRKPIWWLGLERLVAASDEIEFQQEGAEVKLPAATVAQKRRAYDAVADYLTATPQHCEQVCNAFARRYGISFMALTDQVMMTPAMLREMRDSGLVEIGAHTVSHPNLAQLGTAEAWREIVESRDDLAALLGEEIGHFAYPYGSAQAAGPREFALCREAGLTTAVTTRTGNLFGSHRNAMHALPRLHVDGRYQDDYQLDALMSGALAALRQRFRPLPD